ncbi:MAG: hypothetical protein ACKV0T_02205 [Planctomycetales bacterium]
MTRKSRNRLIMTLLFLGGPLVGYLVRGDRGVLFGLVVSVLALIWFVMEETKLL